MPYESPNAIILRGLQCALLLFAFNALTAMGGIGQYGFLSFAAAPLAVLYLLARKWEGDDISYGLKCGAKFLIPFLPFFTAFCIIKFVFWNNGGDWVLDYPAVFSIVFLCAVCFAALREGKAVTQELFFTGCALGTGFYVLDIVMTSMQCGVGLWDTKNWVVPYSTTYGRCIMIPAGLAFLGFFVLDKKNVWLRWFCMTTGCAGFIAATGFIAVRAVIPAVGFAFASALAVIYSRGDKKLLWPLFGGAAALVLILGLASPLPQKILLGIQESTEVVSTDAASKTLNTILNEGKNPAAHKETPEEEELQKSLNNSMGGRLAVWQLAKIMVSKSPVFGYGEGRPAKFVDIKELFKYSTDYLVHFHSDYIQTAMVGGFLLLLGLLATQLWLVWIARKDPLRLYLIVSICSFGIFEIGFLEVSVFSSFLAAWTLLSTWHGPQTMNSELSESMELA